MQRAVLHGVMLRRTGIVTSAGIRNDPGSAVHRSARATRCTASGKRLRDDGDEIDWYTLASLAPGDARP